jgi:hypothetical protein
MGKSQVLNGGLTVVGGSALDPAESGGFNERIIVKYEGTAGSRSSFRTPDKTLESQNETLYLRIS